MKNRTLLKTQGFYSLYSAANLALLSLCSGLLLAGKVQVFSELKAPLPDDTAKPEAGGNNTIILLVGAALLIGGGAFYYFKIYKGGKAKAPKKVVSDDDEEDETEFDDPNDAVQQETNDSDE